MFHEGFNERAAVRRQPRACRSRRRPSARGQSLKPSPSASAMTRKTSVLAHVLAQPPTETWGQSFYVENLPTGASNVGTATAAKAPADGYTLLRLARPAVIDVPIKFTGVDPIADAQPINARCIGLPEQKYISDAGKKGPRTGGLFLRHHAWFGLSAGMSELARRELRLL